MIKTSSNVPTLRQLQYLIALEKAGNFRRAAEACFVTQPTLSAGIFEIEKLLGLPVLDRSQHKKLIFTAFGLEVLATAKAIMPRLENLSHIAQQMSKPLSGDIRLGLIPTMAPYLLPTLLPALQKNFPNIDFQIVEAMSAQLVSKLEESTLDIALMAFPYETPNLKQQIFFEEPFLCASQKKTFKKNQKLTLKDLDAHKLLLLEDGHCLRDHALSACKMQDINDKKTLSATSLLTIIQMVSQGHGITLLPQMVVDHGALPKELELHSFKNTAKSTSPSRKIGATWRGENPRASDIMAILDEMTKILK
jgi:LysR family hydrogen peroxide-inducible transcriptional activator